MFIPNNFCFIRRKSTANSVYGDPTYLPKEKVPFALVRFDLKTDNSTVRADSSATRGNVNEYHASGRVLFPVSVRPKWGDILIIEGRTFKIQEVEPRYNVLGKLDHYEVDTMRSEDRFGDEA